MADRHWQRCRPLCWQLASPGLHAGAAGCEGPAGLRTQPQSDNLLHGPLPLTAGSCTPPRHMHVQCASAQPCGRCTGQASNRVNK
jgi:hypothetical protein